MLPEAPEARVVTTGLVLDAARRGVAGRVS